MPTEAELLRRVRAICLALPEATEEEKWEKPHFCVAGKIFAGFGTDGDLVTLGFKLEKAHAFALVDEPGFRPSPYVGKHGWVTMDLRRVADWDEVAALVTESYRLIAPKRLARQVQSTQTS